MMEALTSERYTSLSGGSVIGGNETGDCSVCAKSPRRQEDRKTGRGGVTVLSVPSPPEDRKTGRQDGDGFLCSLSPADQKTGRQEDSRVISNTDNDTQTTGGQVERKTACAT